MRVAICDDEKSQLNYLNACVHRFLEKQGFSFHIDLFESAEKFWFSWEKDSFSVILLDIQMQGQSGMDLARELRKRGDNSAIIFITGLPDYIGEGYDVSAVHYLIKPIDENKLFTAMEKAIEAIKKQPKKLIFSTGGEAQKIAIARALYRNAPFVVLDEPTAALDPVSEFEIYRRFNSFTDGKTAVYISHRLSSCRFCDKIVVFDKGRIVQTGSHEKLLADEGGQYSALWNAQAKYYITA